jgi:hypothetical protein
MEDAVLMNRRETLARLTAMTGAIAIGAELFLTGCRSPDAANRTKPFSAEELALIGYFTSEIACTKALRYVEAPGHFDGDVPYRKGDRAFYNPSRRIGFA